MQTPDHADPTDRRSFCHGPSASLCRALPCARSALTPAGTSSGSHWGSRTSRRVAIKRRKAASRAKRIEQRGVVETKPLAILLMGEMVRDLTSCAITRAPRPLSSRGVSTMSPAERSHSRPNRGQKRHVRGDPPRRCRSWLRLERKLMRSARHGVEKSGARLLSPGGSDPGPSICSTTDGVVKRSV